MEKYIAKTISVLFHPLLIPTYTMLILLNIDIYFALLIPDPAKWRLLILIFVLTFLFPSFITIILLKRRIINSLEMKTREERIFPILITALFFYLTYFLFKKLDLAVVFNYFALGATLLVIIALFINFFWKISIHMVALGGMFGSLLGISLSFLIELPLLLTLVILIAGLTGYARLKTGSHIPSQVYIGFLSGAVIMLALFWMAF